MCTLLSMCSNMYTHVQLCVHVCACAHVGVHVCEHVPYTCVPIHVDKIGPGAFTYIQHMWFCPRPGIRLSLPIGIKADPELGTRHGSVTNKSDGSGPGECWPSHEQCSMAMESFCPYWPLRQGLPRAAGHTQQWGISSVT